MEIKAEASRYLREISAVLNRVPREMLLLLKTNDLLRGIETYLHTRNSSSSFINMSKCCVKLINSYEREEFAKNMLPELTKQLEAKTYFKNLLHLFKFYLSSYFIEQLNLFKIYFYQLFLYTLNIWIFWMLIIIKFYLQYNIEF